MTARPLLLVGAGGLAREVLATIDEINTIDRPRWDVVGLCDDNPATHGQLVDGRLVLGSTEVLADHPDVGVVVCVASARNQGARKQIVDRLALPDERRPAIVHPAASIAMGTRVGAGSVFLAFVAVTAPQEIGEHVIAMPHTTITHDDQVGDHVTFASRVSLSGNVTVGERAYLGSGALVREGLTIGPGALIGMGAVVLDDVPPSEVWVGNPARRLRTFNPTSDLARTTT